MALPQASPHDTGILTLLPYDKKRAAVVTALSGFDYDYVYRVTGWAGDETNDARVCIWQLETNLLPRIARERLERRGFQVTKIIPEVEGPFYVRFAWEYTDDTDWPAAPYHGPNPWTIRTWDSVPATLRTDAVAGPAGVTLCDLEQTPAALIPVPGVPGLDYSYADMGMVDAAPAIAPILDTIHYRQRALPVAEIVRTEAGSVYARVNISTTQRPMWHCIPIARIISRAERKMA